MKGNYPEIRPKYIYIYVLDKVPKSKDPNISVFEDCVEDCTELLKYIYLRLVG